MPLHNCPSPDGTIEKCFKEFDEDEVDGYLHTLLEAKYDDADAIVADLIPYFESAHLDARICFHDEIGINLHPDGDSASEPDISYPKTLPVPARRGLFGEALAGLLTESLTFIGEYEWTIPVFLFRYHNAAAEYLYTLRRDPTRERQIAGRTGDDFIAIALDEDGGVAHVLAGEAKWRASLTQSVADDLLKGPKIDDPVTGEKVHSGKGIYTFFNDAIDPPHGLKQLQRILMDIAADDYADAIVSIDEAVYADQPTIPRTNLILLAGNGGKRRSSSECLIDSFTKPAEYTSAADLQVIEVIFKDGEVMIDALYDRLFEDG